MAIHRCTPIDYRQVLESVLPGDEVHLKPGRYHSTATLCLPSGIQLIGAAEVVMSCEGDGPIVSVTGNDCQLSRIGFVGTMPGQVLVEISNAEQIHIAECDFNGGTVAGAAVLVKNSRLVDILSCNVESFSILPDIFSSAIILRYSEGQIARNRCHDNAAHGIAFLFSKGRAEQNECWGQEFGIVVQGGTPGTASEVTLVGNRCHDNAWAGIVFSSSKGRGEHNECWGNRNHSGILVQYDSIIPNAQLSEVTLIGNRCYDNKQAGITFSASKGRAEQNECWGNRSTGIAATNNNAGQPSEVTLVGNRCHDNEGAGIDFFSSRGWAEHNVCWGSRRRSGIIVQHDFRIPNAQPSEVTLIGNLSYDNEEAGITFLSSKGRAEQNECWGSRRRSGIIVQHDFRTLNAQPSEVTLVGNRCHDNAQYGILFISSRGQTKQNECWSNSDNELLCLENSEVSSHGNLLRPSFHPEQLRKSRFHLHPLAAWLTDPATAEPGAEPLADYLSSGGCPDCFTRFWTATGRIQPSYPHPADLADATQESRTHTYEVKSNGNTVGLVRQPVSPRHGSEGLTALLSTFSFQIKEWRRHRDVDRKRWWRSLTIRADRSSTQSHVPKWMVAHISADTEAFEKWLEEAKKYSPDLEVKSFDFTNSDVNLTRLVEGQLLAGRSGWRHRLVDRAEALLFMPVSEFLLALAAVTALSLVTILWLRLSIDFHIQVWPMPDAFEDLTKEASRLFDKIRRAWSEHKNTLIPMLIVWTLVTELLVNRNLPRDLWIPNPVTKILLFILDWFLHIEKISKLWQDIIDDVPTWLKKLWTRIQSFFPFLLQSEASARFWIRRKIYGYRLFERLRHGYPAARLVALRNVDVPESKRDIQRLFEVCPPDQPVFFITQMSGLSMLTSAYLDVWFGNSPVYKQDRHRAYFVHDVDSGMIPPLPEQTFSTGLVMESKIPAESSLDDVTTAESTSTLFPLGRILGWYASTDKPEDKQKKNEAWEAVLVHPIWVVKELLLALVVGSTPHAHMMISRDIGEFSQYIDALQKELEPYLHLFQLDGPPLIRGRITKDDVDIPETDRAVQNGVGLLMIRDKKKQWNDKEQWKWVGRGGYRRHLASGLRELYARREKAPGESEEYLARLMMCGELYNLIRMKSLFDKIQSANSSSERDQQLLPLHMEAALFLVEERFRIVPHLSEAAVLLDRWRSFIEEVLQKRPLPPLSALQVGRLCSMFLKVKDRYRRKGQDVLGTEQEDQLDEAIQDPFREIKPPQHLWDVFLKDVRQFLRLLAYRELATADILLTAKLNQEWNALPEGIKERLRRRLTNLSHDWLTDMNQKGSPEELLQWAEYVKEQPAMVVGGLSRLAITYVCANNVGETFSSALIQVAKAVLRLRRAAGDEAQPHQMPTMSYSPASSAPIAARTLLFEERYLENLCRILEEGNKSRVKIKTVAQRANCEIQGIALGVHGSLHDVLEIAKEKQEVEELVIPSQSLPLIPADNVHERLMSRY